MSDTFRIRAITKLRNGYIIEAREGRSLNQRQAAEAIGVTPSQLSACESMKRVPDYVVVRIADYLDLTMDQVAPGWAREWKGPRTVVVTTEVQADNLLAFADAHRARSIAVDPVDAAFKADAVARIQSVLQTLSFREREIIKLRYGLSGADNDSERNAYTLEEVGRIFKISHARVREIEAKAIRKLQHPVRSRKLQGLLDEGGE